MTLQFEFIDTGYHTGQFNMDFDVQRAEAVDAGTANPMIRVYRWDPWCISLGRHQKETDINAEATKRDGIDIVRRPTGGRAILHAEELTYSAIFPSEGRGIMEVYKLISEALSAGLATLAPGVEMAKSQPNFAKLYKEPGSVPCFSSSARYEIIHNEKKLVGSAQRRIGGTVLQHGSILIGDAHLRLSEYLAMDAEASALLRSDLEAQTCTLNEVLGRSVLYDEVREAIRKGFETSWDLRFTDTVLETADLHN